MLNFLAAVAVASTTTCGYTGPLDVIGLAEEVESGEFVYCELFLPAEGEQTRVLYYSPEGRKIAQKTLFGPASEVGAGTALPEMSQLDDRFGERREVRQHGGGWQLSYLPNKDAQWKNKFSDGSDIDIVDVGIDHLVRERWNQLDSGTLIEFKIASPIHGRGIKLRAKAVPCKSDPGLNLCIQFDLAQPLLRMFVGDVNMIYKRENKQLQEFEGISNLLDSEQKNQRVRVRYH